MGQKVSPHGLRVGVIKDWESKWYADKKSFADFLAEDNKVREFVKKKLYVAGVSKVLIERAAEHASLHECSPISDIRASAEYRRELVRLSVRDGLTLALNK